MTDYTDGFGIWRKLGVIPVTKEFTYFDSAGRSTVFRATFQLTGGNTWDEYKFQYYQQSWVEVCPYYMDDNLTTFNTASSRSTSLKPNPQTQIISIFLDRSLDDNLFVNRKIAVRKRNYRRNRYLGDPDVLIPYSLELHALLPV